MNILVTGASGFFGEILCQFLTDSGHAVHGVDILPQRQKTSYGFSQADIRDKFELSKVFASIRPNAVVHAAAILAHERPGEDELWTSNVEGTKIVCETAIEAGCGSLVFLSSNCLWAEEFDHPVTEAEPPNPIEIYGRSKWEGEKIVQSFNSRMDTTIFRSPTIVSAGRLGLLGILFQFIEEGRRVYIVGRGRNRYQFVYALDYCRAILLALEKQLSGTYNVGSSDVPTMADSYQHVINQADSGARLVHLPRGLTIFLLRILHVLRLSPLGPYQYRMIASSFEFDITKLKHDAGWQPKLTNNDMLLEAYNHYKKNKLITSDQSTSAHNRVARGGILDLVRKLS
jgi:nucleoside-diphosphate-sugar epimerase